MEEKQRFGIPSISIKLDSVIVSREGERRTEVSEAEVRRLGEIEVIIKIYCMFVDEGFTNACNVNAA